MHNLFLVYFVNLYMFRVYPDPSSGSTTVCVQQLVLLFFLEDSLLSWMDWNNTSRTTDSHLKRIISTNCSINTVVPLDGRPGYTSNMYRLTKYTKNKLYFLCTLSVFTQQMLNVSLLLFARVVSMLGNPKKFYIYRNVT